MNIGGHNICHIGDCRDVMRQLITDGVKVQTCVTSPPYFGLRDYGHSQQLGLETSIDKYIANMVEVFNLVRDLLADDGTVWVNMGDSYTSGNRKSRDPGQSKMHPAFTGNHNRATTERAPTPKGLKAKDLIGVPWRLAFALQASGWHLRQDIIWHKPNPIPESVRDRCTKAHEYIFLLSKRKQYYFNQDAIREPAKSDKGSTANKRSVWTVTTKPYKGAHFATFPPALIEPCILAGARIGDIVLDPFFGSGTTGEVAQKLNRRWIGIEINEEYKALQENRIARQNQKSLKLPWED